jgi:predicted alpha/beta-fold hydrolase
MPQASLERGNTMRNIVAVLAWMAVTSSANAQETRPRVAVVTDQRSDGGSPPRLMQVRYSTGAVEVPARSFIAPRPGPHPTMLLLHGFSGTELNLDLARAVQRAGWNVLVIQYRGTWVTPGQSSFTHTVEDARAARRHKVARPWSLQGRVQELGGTLMLVFPGGGSRVSTALTPGRILHDPVAARG